MLQRKTPSETKPKAQQALRAVLSWYFRRIYGHYEGLGVLPFYCDPKRVGHFAVSPDELTNNSEAALFRLFIALSMFQALRDVIIFRQQVSMSAQEVKSLASVEHLADQHKNNPCECLGSLSAFEAECSVNKSMAGIDCVRYPGAVCQVKEATRIFHRMGDMGKLPTSAWLRIWKDGGISRLLAEVSQQTPSPSERAALLVQRFAGVYRVGEKLATMFVGNLSTPALAPGLAPWYPAIDGNALLVLDTNASKAIDLLRRKGSPKTYEARAKWLQQEAKRIDLQEFHHEVPSYSPRLVQQALYHFCSKSNRTDHQDPCVESENCLCPSEKLCPFRA